MSINEPKLNAEWTNALLMERVLGKLESIENILLKTYMYPRGLTLTSILHLKAKAPVTRIDFMTLNRSKNITMGRFETGGLDVINTLGIPVSHLIIYNTGPGGMFFDTNRPYSDNTADTPVYANSDYEIHADIPSIVSINLVAGDNDAKVRLTAIV